MIFHIADQAVGTYRRALGASWGALGRLGVPLERLGAPIISAVACSSLPTLIFIGSGESAAGFEC